MPDPFGEGPASITPRWPADRFYRELAPIQYALNQIESTTQEVGPTLDAINLAQMLPTNPIPFNEMAGYFGAAGTILSRFTNKGLDYVSISDLFASIVDVWCSTNGHGFCVQVMEIIMKYYAGHTDQSIWEEAVAVRKTLLAEGFGGERAERINSLCTCQESADLCRRMWFYNAK